MGSFDVGGLDDEELAELWAACMADMRRRGLVRTGNSPVGDYAERIVCKQLGLERRSYGEKGFDALGPDGTRYEIKGRRLTPISRSREVGAIRDVDSRPFDYLLVAFFDEVLKLQEIWQVPIEVVAEAPLSGRTGATKFMLTRARMADPRTKRLFPVSLDERHSD